jgi:hypothetical protein
MLLESEQRFGNRSAGIGRDCSGFGHGVDFEPSSEASNQFAANSAFFSAANTQKMICTIEKMVYTIDSTASLPRNFVEQIRGRTFLTRVMCGPFGQLWNQFHD